MSLASTRASFERTVRSGAARRKVLASVAVLGCIAVVALIGLRGRVRSELAMDGADHVSTGTHRARRAQYHRAILASFQVVADAPNVVEVPIADDEFERAFGK